MNNLISLFLLLISFLIYNFYSTPVFDEIGILNQKLTKLDASLTESKDLRDVISQKETTYSGFTDEEKEKINKLIPNSIDNVKLVIDIDDIASKYNMKIRDINIDTGELVYGTEISPKSYGTATLKFTVTAPYDRFRLFLSDIEDSLRLVDVSSLSFNAGEKDMNDYNVELKTYWLKEIKI